MEGVTGEEKGRADARPAGAWREVAAVALKIGVLGFGGPAAHVGMMREEVVRRRGWVDDARFLDLFGIASLVPGPSSTELSIALGYVRAGIPGLLIGGALFILPSMLLVLAMAWAYTSFGSVPATSWLLYGIKPAVITIVAVAIAGLVRTAAPDLSRQLIAVGAFAVFLIVGSPLEILLLGGGVQFVVSGAWRQRRQRHLPMILPVSGAAAGKASLAGLFGVFVKIGAVSFGGGYILLAFLQADLVHGTHWLTDRQVLDAVAVGQVTPGPVFTTATFLGYLIAGVPGAIVATAGIFAPAFIYIGVLFPWIPRIRSSPTLGAFLAGVNSAALGLMAAATWQLAISAIVDWITVGICGAALILIVLCRPNTVWIVLGGAAAGLAARAVGG